MTKITKTLFALSITATMLAPMAVLAQANSDAFGVNVVKNSIILEGTDVRKTAASIINVALGFLGIIAVVIVLVGGFKYMISGGDEGKTKEARGWIISGIIGLAIILSGWAITNFVIEQLLKATQE